MDGLSDVHRQSPFQTNLQVPLNGGTFRFQRVYLDRVKGRGDEKTVQVSKSFWHFSRF
jgi:hypothetical protein